MMAQPATKTNSAAPIAMAIPGPRTNSAALAGPRLVKRRRLASATCSVAALESR